MTLLEVAGETECAVTTPGEPASAQHITGRCSEILRDLNSVPEDKWELTAALSVAGKDLTGVRQTKQALSTSPESFHFSCGASRNVTRDFLSR